GIAQLVEHNLAKVGVASSSLVSRSKFKKALIERWGLFYTFLNITQITNTNSDNQKYQMETSNQQGVSKNRASLVVSIHPNTIAVQRTWN
ncbi:hypothetical protein, partial [Acinetobacter johnsonii]|uniref:hypothetical protein n=2 Tax=Acinetobacter johnsonii TaxID=40214 RepID=UPI00280D771A